MLLAAVGRGDLSVGRIFEGHVNALYLIQKYGSAAQAERFATAAGEGGIFGVWNTDAPDDPLRIVAGKFEGKKSFASGVDGLSHAIVTVSDDSGRQMYIVPTDELGVDRSWWRPLGMRASGSHVADFTGLRVEPGLGAGACRRLYSATLVLGGRHPLPRRAGRRDARAPRYRDPPSQRDGTGRQSLPVAPARAHGRGGGDRLSLARARWPRPGRTPLPARRTRRRSSI